MLTFHGYDICSENLHCPNHPSQRFDINGTDFRIERHERRVAVNEYANNHPTAQETKLFRNFGDLVLSGKIDDHWPEIALKTQQVMNACLDSARNGGGEVAL